MLHQLLFALIGRPGSLIKLQGDRLALDSTVTFLTTSQKQLINGMCFIGYHYAKIQAFIQESCSTWSQPRQFVSAQDEDTVDSRRSAYRRSFCYGLNQVMTQYKAVILNFEQEYLDNKFFSYANLQAQLNKYYLLFPELYQVITRIVEEDLRGGAILQLLYTKVQQSNMWIREAYEKLFRECYRVLYNQISGWLLYGKLLDAYSQFFIHRVEVSSSVEQERDWDTGFTLEIGMVPVSIVSRRTAEKILFVGKSVRILRLINKEMSLLPQPPMVEVVKMLEDYESFRFDSVIEQVRHLVAHDLMELIMKRENLMKELETLKNYYLMSRGEFFHIFLEESASLMASPHTDRAIEMLNKVQTSNTFLRLHQDPNPKLRFELKQNGFSFKNFSSLANLNVIGNVTLKPNHFLRFQPVKNFGGSLWYNMRQNVDNGFTIRFSFRFKKLQYNSMTIGNTTAGTLHSRASGGADHQSTTTLCYVLQNVHEISSWKKDAPISLLDIKQYVCIKVGMVESNNKRNECNSFLEVTFCDGLGKNREEKIVNQILLNKNINFAEEDFHQLQITYHPDNTMRVAVDVRNTNASQNTLTCKLSLSKLINLDMGKCYMGFLQHSQNSNFAVDIISWEMLGNNLAHSNDYWSELTPNYSIEWPLNLILSQQLVQKYKQIFKLFFPVRSLQIELDRLWVRLSRGFRNRGKTVRRQDAFLLTKLCAFRSECANVLNNLWSFFQSDVVETQWNKLIEALKKTDDFESMRQYLDMYILSISCMCFLTSPTIIKLIFEIIRTVKDFVNLCNRLEAEPQLGPFSNLFADIEAKYRNSYRAFNNELKIASRLNTSPHVYQLLLRLDYNVDRGYE